MAVAAGPGFVRLIRSLGAGAIIWGGQSMNPSAEEIAAAAESIPATDVIVLPNNTNIVATSELAKGLVTTKRLHVLPTVSVLQGVAGLLAYNAQQGPEENLARMAEASRSIRWGEVTQAVRTGQADGVAFEQGQVIGLLEGDLVTVQDTVVKTVCELVRRMAPSSEALVTLYYGAGVSAEEAQATAEAVTAACDGVEVEIVDGGQPLYPYLVSLEG